MKERAFKYCVDVDLLAAQRYENAGTHPIEAKYVFPLDEMAAVCGFEAFINGKHVVGAVKEKEQVWWRVRIRFVTFMYLCDYMN